MKQYYFIVFIVAIAWIPCSLMAQVSSTATSIGIDAKVIAPITIENTGSTSLDFGTISRSTAVGYVTVTPEGDRSASGGVSVLSASDYSAAPFTVGDAAFNITLPADGTVELTRSGGTEKMSVDGFDHNSTLTLSSAGTESFSVGATLTIGASQVAGEYSGSFSVTVAYQ
jgi:hypothetical protein